jgi:hypothetical protein
MADLRTALIFLHFPQTTKLSKFLKKIHTCHNLILFLSPLQNGNLYKKKSWLQFGHCLKLSDGNPAILVSYECVCMSPRALLSKRATLSL